MADEPWVPYDLRTRPVAIDISNTAKCQHSQQVFCSYHTTLRPPPPHFSLESLCSLRRFFPYLSLKLSSSLRFSSRACFAFNICCL